MFASHSLAWVLLPLLLQASSGAPVSAVTPGPQPVPWGSVAIHVADPAKPDENYGDVDDGIVGHGVPLKVLISQGYNFSVMPFRDDEIVGLPAWAQSARYDITARVDPADVDAFKKISHVSMHDTIAAFTARQPTAEMLMMQTLLRERFGLQVHWESKERSVYALVVAKGGVRMKPAADPQHGEMGFQDRNLSGKGVPVSFLASLLAVPVGHSVVDRTGLTGAYDFDLRFNPQEDPAKQNNDPDIFTAVQEQLGLKLQSTRAAVPVLVIDHVEPPTPN